MKLDGVVFQAGVATYSLQLAAATAIPGFGFLCLEVSSKRFLLS